MNIERFVARKQKNDYPQTVCGGSFCRICSQYCPGGSGVVGQDKDGNNHEYYTPPPIKIEYGICEYCVEDLEIKDLKLKKL